MDHHQLSPSSARLSHNHTPKLRKRNSEGPAAHSEPGSSFWKSHRLLHPTLGALPPSVTAVHGDRVPSHHTGHPNARSYSKTLCAGNDTLSSREAASDSHISLNFFLLEFQGLKYKWQQTSVLQMCSVNTIKNNNNEEPRRVTNMGCQAWDAIVGQK